MRPIVVCLPFLLLTGCQSPAPVTAPQPPRPIASAYTMALIGEQRGVAAWRPSSVEHVLSLDGQRCRFVDLGLRCLPAPEPAASH